MESKTRDIIFRGQTRRYGEKMYMNGTKLPSVWMYGGVLQGTGSFSIIYGCEDPKDKSAVNFGKHTVYTDTLGQYTGLTDKNDKMIFEGDILRTANGIIFVVEWEKNGRFLGFTIEKKRRIVYVSREPKAEIIGNIYDNPELLTA